MLCKFESSPSYPAFRSRALSLSLERLRHVCRLASEEDVRVFDDTLKNIDAKTLTQEDIQDLLCVLMDDTEDEEVMFGLIHLIENNDMISVIAALIKVAPKMKMKASGWLNTFIYRILNGDSSRDILIKELKQGIEGLGCKEIIRRLTDMMGDNSEKIRGRAALVLSSLASR